jgi:hypothetical protein
MYYVLSDGRGGEIDVDLSDDGMVPSFHLIDNVIQDGDQDTSTIDPPEEGDGLPEGGDGDEGESDLEEGEPEQKSEQPEQKEKRQRGYRYNKRFNCWVPTWKVLVHANHYEELKKNAEATKKFKRLFRGQQCRFKRRSKDIITACSIAAAGASDKGVQSVIFGTLKAIAEEMDIKISAKQLSKGTPARNSLRNWEVNLAAGYLAEVVHQIHLDAERLQKKYGNRVKLQITLITDHGNLDGIDHFVKMICWASEDEKATNFCGISILISIEGGIQR